MKLSLRAFPGGSHASCGLTYILETMLEAAGLLPIGFGNPRLHSYEVTQTQTQRLAGWRDAYGVIGIELAIQYASS
jgi:hypothetical protein